MAENSTLQYTLHGALLLAAAACAAPAHADHLGPSEFGGGGATVFGPETLDGGHWATGFRLTYTRPDRRSDEELTSLAADEVDAHNTDYNLVGSMSAAYGVSHHLTVSAELPYIRRHNLRDGTPAGVERLGNVAGIGDVSLLAKYRLTEGQRPGVALVAGIKLPTGSTHRKSPAGERLETEHQPGTGSWDPILGISASVPVGRITVAASALYQWSTRGAQQTRLGDRLHGGIAFSHRFTRYVQGETISHNHHDGDELDEHPEPPEASWDAFIEAAGEWEGRQAIGGAIEQASGGSWVYMAPGVRYNAAARWSASVALAVPVWQRIRASHPDNSFRIVLSLGQAW